MCMMCGFGMVVGGLVAVALVGLVVWLIVRATRRQPPA